MAFPAYLVINKYFKKYRYDLASSLFVMPHGSVRLLQLQNKIQMSLMMIHIDPSGTPYVTYHSLETHPSIFMFSTAFSV